MGSTISPVVVKTDERPIFITKLQGRIGQSIRNSKRSEEGPSARKTILALLSPTTIEAADQDVIAALNQGPRADVRKPRTCVRRVVINLRQGYAGRPVFSAQDCSICSRIQSYDHGRFQVIARLEVMIEAALRKAELLTLGPIVVAGDQTSLRIK